MPAFCCILKNSTCEHEDECACSLSVEERSMCLHFCVCFDRRALEAEAECEAMQRLQVKAVMLNLYDKSLFLFT